MPKVGKKEKKILFAIARKKMRTLPNDTDVQEAIHKIETIPSGRPRLYETPIEMETLIEGYIAKQKTENKPLTITGLAIALGMDRRNLLEYSKRDEFYPIINKYRQVLLSQVEENLTDKNKFTPGQIFYLKNNYKQDYQDRIEVNNNHSGSISLVELSRLADSIDEGDIVEGELLQNEPLTEDNSQEV